MGASASIDRPKILAYSAQHMIFHAKMIPFHKEALLRLFFEENCVHCHQSLRLTESGICSLCRGKFLPVSPLVCVICATQLPATSKKRKCLQCLRKKSPVARAWMLYQYNQPMQDLLHAVKFKSRSRYLNLFDRDIQRISSNLSGFDCVVPVPMSRKGIQKRGFNQARILADKVASELHIPLREALRHDGATEKQSHLDRNLRRVNALTSFSIRPKFQISGNVLLVDDIYTTGATVERCADLLKQAGATSVGVFVLARPALTGLPKQDKPNSRSSWDSLLDAFKQSKKILSLS